MPFVVTSCASMVHGARGPDLVVTLYDIWSRRTGLGVKVHAKFRAICAQTWPIKALLRSAIYATRNDSS